MSMKTALSRSLRSQHKLSGRGLSLSSNRGLAATSNASANLTSRKSEQTTYGQSSRSDLEPAFNTTTARFQTPAVDVGSYPLYRNAQPVPQKSTAQQTPFTDLLNAISYTLTTSKSPSLPLLHHLLRIYRSDPEHWSKYAHANPEKRYTRNLVFGIPGVFNLLLLVWTPGQKSLVHDHADAHCLMKVLKGQIRETRFATPENPGRQGPLLQTACRTYDLDKVTYMADELGLHSIANPHPTEYAVSLHLYTPPHAATRGCNVFDEENGAAKHVLQNAYDSVEGVPTNTP